jgi:hypothetical protein
LQDPELEACGAYVGPEKVGERVSLSRIRYLLKNTEAMKDSLPRFDWDNLAGASDSMMMNKGDEFVTGFMSSKAQDESSSSLKKGKGKGKGKVANSDEPVVAAKKKGKAKADKLPTDPQERERLAGKNFATAYFSRPEEIEEIFSKKFKIVVGDVMCDMRKIIHSPEAAWSKADFNTEDDTANESIYLMIASALVGGYLRYFNKD